MTQIRMIRFDITTYKFHNTRIIHQSQMKKNTKSCIDASSPSFVPVGGRLRLAACTTTPTHFYSPN